MKTFVKVVSETLTDNSLVYNVLMIHHDQVILFPCISESDAIMFADALVNGLDRYTVVSVELT